VAEPEENLRAELRVVGAHDRVDSSVLELGGQVARHLHDCAPRAKLAGEAIDVDRESVYATARAWRPLDR
jgi:hypothetical protein